jgi:hypothetical protein
MRRILLLIAISLAACAIGLATSAFAVPCSLTSGDLNSLAHPACDDCQPLTEKDVDTLPPKDQQQLCIARNFYNVVHGKLATGRTPEQIAATMTIDDLAVRYRRFITAQENDEVKGVIAKILTNEAIQQHGR